MQAVRRSTRCPVEPGVRLLGDRWSLLIVRELLFGAYRFNEIHRELPGLSRTLLSQRLQYLAANGIVERDESAEGVRYTLTRAGADLSRVLDAIGEWSVSWHGGMPDEGDSPLRLLNDMYRTLRREALPDGGVTIEFRFTQHPRAWVGSIRMGRDRDGVTMGGEGATPDLIVTTRTDVLRALGAGERTCASTISSGDIRFEGSVTLARNFGRLFAVPSA